MFVPTYIVLPFLIFAGLAFCGLFFPWLVANLMIKGGWYDVPFVVWYTRTERPLKEIWMMYGRMLNVLLNPFKWARMIYEYRVRKEQEASQKAINDMLERERQKERERKEAISSIRENSKQIRKMQAKIRKERKENPDLFTDTMIFGPDD